MDRFVDNPFNKAKVKESRRSDFQQIQRSGTVLRARQSLLSNRLSCFELCGELPGRAQYHRIDISQQIKEKTQCINP